MSYYGYVIWLIIMTNSFFFNSDEKCFHIEGLGKFHLVLFMSSLCAIKKLRLYLWNIAVQRTWYNKTVLDVTWASQCVKSPATRLIIQQLIQEVNINENIKVRNRWLFVRGIHREPVVSLHRGKRFHCMTLSWRGKKFPELASYTCGYNGVFDMYIIRKLIFLSLAIHSSVDDFKLFQGMYCRVRIALISNCDEFKWEHEWTINLTSVQ